MIVWFFGRTLTNLSFSSSAARVHSITIFQWSRLYWCSYAIYDGSPFRCWYLWSDNGWCKLFHLPSLSVSSMSLLIIFFIVICIVNSLYCLAYVILVSLSEDLVLLFLLKFLKLCTCSDTSHFSWNFNKELAWRQELSFVKQWSTRNGIF